MTKNSMLCACALRCLENDSLSLKMILSRYLPSLVAFNVFVCSCLSSGVLERLNIFKGNIPTSNVTVFNAFINQDVFAKASFGKTQLDRISYGSYKTMSLSNSEDYIIQFISIPSGGN